MAGKPRSLRYPLATFESEIAEMQRSGCSLVENSRFAVYCEIGRNIPAVVNEVGRLREETFRRVGEGIGKSMLTVSTNRTRT